MTEKDYINTKALGTITAAINTLRDLVPAILTSVMNEKSYGTVMATLYSWQERLFDKIELDDK